MVERNQETYKANAAHEEVLEARFQKQMMCMARGKRCATCDGNDIYGDKCKWYRVKNERR